MRVIFLGTPPFVQPIREVLAKHFTLVESLNEADLAVVAAYGRILIKEELNTPKYGCINVHPSLLPKLRGSSPIQAAILNGDKISGITIIKMDAGVDHGPILFQEKIVLSDSDNFDTLSKKMFHRAAEILLKIIADFVAGKITPTAQDHSGASYCQHLTKETGYFEINNSPSADKLDRMIRAYYPWPGVWTKWSPSRHTEGAKRPKDLKIVKFLPNVTLSKAKGIKLYSSPSAQNDKFFIQMEGKKPISFKDFLNGYPDFPIKQLQKQLK